MPGHRIHRILASIFLIIIAAGCSELRNNNPVISIPLPSYESGVKQILEMQCVSCHSGVLPDGDYDLSSFIGILDTGTDDIPNAIPGDASSVILQKIGSSGSMNKYIGSQENENLLHRWVIEARIGLRNPTAHLDGWTNPADKENFHGVFLQRTNWNIAACMECHGTDFKGGIAERPCLVCHTETPTDCTTCHGRSFNPSAAPPKDLLGNVTTVSRGVGAHETHLSGGNFSKKVECTECHTVPARYDDEGHIDDTPNAEVIFGEFTAQFEGRLGASPVKQDLTCANVYCHGAFPAGNHSNAPIWNITDGSQAACGSCHGIPPTTITRNNITHPNIFDCAFCHASVIAPGTFTIIDKSKHINGVVNF